MTYEALSVDVTSNPELLSLAQEVKRSGRPRALRTDGEALAQVLPMPKRQHRPRGKRTSADDPIGDIVGMGRSGKPSDVSAHVDEFLAASEVANNHP